MNKLLLLLCLIAPITSKPTAYKGVVTLYDAFNFQGQSRTFNVSEDTDIDLSVYGWDSRARSAKVLSGCVDAYSNSECGDNLIGLEYGTDYSDLSKYSRTGGTWDKSIIGLMDCL